MAYQALLLPESDEMASLAMLLPQADSMASHAKLRPEPDKMASGVSWSWEALPSASDRSIACEAVSSTSGSSLAWEAISSASGLSMAWGAISLIKQPPMPCSNQRSKRWPYRQCSCLRLTERPPKTSSHPRLMAQPPKTGSCLITLVIISQPSYLTPANPLLTHCLLPANMPIPAPLEEAHTKDNACLGTLDLVWTFCLGAGPLGVVFWGSLGPYVFGSVCLNFYYSLLLHLNPPHPTIHNTLWKLYLHISLCFV